MSLIYGKAEFNIRKELIKMVKLEIKTDQQGVSSLVKSAIFTEIKRMEIGLNRTEEEIKKYENRYKIDSKVFLNRFTAEDLEGGDTEYIKWAGEIKLKERIVDDMNKLRDIEYVSK